MGGRGLLHSQTRCGCRLLAHVYLRPALLIRVAERRDTATSHRATCTDKHAEVYSKAEALDKLA